MISVFEPLYGPWFILVTSKQQGPAGLLRHQFQRQPRWEDRDATAISTCRLVGQPRA
jgi:hypothetical protein